MSAKVIPLLLLAVHQNLIIDLHAYKIESSTFAKSPINPVESQHLHTKVFWRFIARDLFI